ncbi:ctr copper transporter family protein-like protein [Truncatella angustata]|uniref:Copper transport protein n=1 Tax=Truncatella angustata TaxID=152316 RepID=A0A9P9A1Y6_9PEZI|nr:ctr copper transporter family protein-like protein [Truncatella angustata]KAH6660091.1 ctr copper transporter family protein-like protein [Truncatella angustata]
MDHAHMDHSQMDHSGMDHGDMDHGGHGGMTDMCNMNMLFTWDSTNLCIVFRSWHVRGTASLVFSLLAIVAICVGYEAVREATRRYESWADKRQETAPRRNQVEVSKRAHVIKATLYAVQCFYAFMMMLLFMTYNGWVMLAVFVGNFIGYIMFGNSTKATKETACH